MAKNIAVSSTKKRRVSNIRTKPTPTPSSAVGKVTPSRTLASGKSKQSSSNVSLKSQIEHQNTTTRKTKPSNVAKKKTVPINPSSIPQKERVSPFGSGKKRPKPIQPEIPNKPTIPSRPIRTKPSFLKLSDQYPILLLPIRIETKFMKKGRELWVRVYPDDIVIETHEQSLAKDEVLAGRRFLFAMKNIGKGQSKQAKVQEQKAAWRELASEFGPERAAWIANKVQAYQTTKLETLKEEAWAAAPKVRALPDYFQFVLYDSNNQIAYQPKGEKIPAALPLMADSQEDTSQQEKAKLVLEFFNTVTSSNEIVGRFGETVGYAHLGQTLGSKGKDRISQIASNMMTHRKKQTSKPPLRSIQDIGRFWTKALIDPTARYPNLVDALYSVFIKNFENSLFDEGARWLENFDAAVAKGMAIKILLTKAPPPYTRMLVVGVKESLNHTASAKLLEELFENHRYTEGLAFLEPGTPTNNTSAIQSGHSESTEDYDRIFEHEFGEKHPVNPRSWGNRLKRYSGIAPQATVFDRCEHADRFEDSYQEYMNGLLWGITGQYFFKVLLGRLVPSSTTFWNRVSQHFRTHVRALGLLPAMRIGNQPYGILPVTNTPKWAAMANSGDEGFGHDLSSILNKLSIQWLTLATNRTLVPQIGSLQKKKFDPDQELLQILGMEPNALSYTLRLYSDRRFLEWRAFDLTRNISVARSVMVWEKLNEIRQGWEKEIVQTKAILRNVGARDTKIEDTLALRLWGMENESTYVWDNISSFAKQPENPKSQTQASPFGYLKAIKEGHLHTKTLPKPDTLLFTLLETIGLHKVKKSAYLSRLVALDQEHSREWIEKLFIGFLDLHTHRLDAWISSLANKRLVEMRQKNREGIYLGAYGWLENLSPDKTSSKTPAPRPAVAKIEGGFIHAPSLNHASAAAVLRNAFITHEEQSQNTFAINITSTRVRRACRILAGIREGQPLAALLGYQVERSLHDKQLDQYIDEFREQYPFSGQNGTPPLSGETSSTESIQPRNVLDGLKLVQNIRLGLQRGGTTKEKVVQAIGVSNLQSAEGKKLLTILADACDTIDAMTDLLLNESIYQWIQGKFEHAGAALQTISGNAKPPEVESIKTPVTGITAQHRVVFILPSNLGTPPIEPELNTSWDIRGAMEPALSLWVGRLFENQGISCRVSFDGPAGKEIEHVTPENLEMYPLDLLYFSKFGIPDNPNPLNDVKGEEGPLEQWIASFIRLKHDLNPQATIAVDFNETSQEQHRTFRQVFQLSQQVIQLFGQSMGVTPDKWVRPEEADSPEVRHQWKNLLREITYRTRRVVVEKKLGNLVNKLKDENQPLSSLIPTLKEATRIGIIGVIPTGSPQENLVTVHRLRQKALDEIQDRIQQYRQFLTEADGLTKEDQTLEESKKEWKLRQQAIQAIFGKDFVVIPHCWAPKQNELTKAFHNSIYPHSAQSINRTHDAANTNRLWTWLQQSAQTHPSLGKLEDLLLYIEAWNTPSGSAEASSTTSVQPYIAQLPLDERHYWVGLSQEEIQVLRKNTRKGKTLSPAEDDFMPRGASSIMAFSATEIDARHQPVYGVLIDEFPELIPHADVQTGVAFQYDQPNSQPPQACLLAVPSQWGGKLGTTVGKWTSEELVEAVKETMNLAKIRAVDFDALGKWQTLTPGLFLPVPALPSPAGEQRESFTATMYKVGETLGLRKVLRHLQIAVPTKPGIPRKGLIIQKFSYNKNRAHATGIRFSKEGLEITPKWALRQINFQILIRALQVVRRRPLTMKWQLTDKAIFSVKAILFDPDTGVFEEKSYSKKLSTSLYLEVTDQKRIVQLHIAGPQNMNVKLSNIVLQGLTYKFW